jgi:serine/threonine protein kinase/formylglycine-generating enzyme required for sulfatase activity
LSKDKEQRRFLERADAILRGAEDPGALAPASGTVIAHYRLIRRLGQGGMGVVWLADDESLKRRVALKLLAAHMTVDREAIWRFGQEAAAAARLDHPHIVAVHDAGEEHGQHYLVMDYVEGVGLDRLLALLRGRRPVDVTATELNALLAAELAIDEAPAPPEESYLRCAVRCVREAASALRHAHTRGVLHRDIKPSNLLIDRAGRVRLVDFGLARIEEAAPVTRTGAILGTLTYMAPEALAGRQELIDPRTDLYGLGAVLFELLAFRPPFLANSLTGLVEEIGLGEPAPLRRFHPGLPRDLERIVLKCLAKDRDRRYATAQDLEEDLARFLEGRPVRARPTGLLTRGRYWARRHPLRAFALGIAFAVAVGAAPVDRYVAARRAAAEAGIERQQARKKLVEHRTLRAELAQVQAELRSKRAELGSRDDDRERNARLLPYEDKIHRHRLRLAQLLEEAHAGLGRAVRLEEAHGGVSAETEAAFANHFLFRYELALEEEDAVGQTLYAAEARRFGIDPARLIGDGALEITVDPPDAEVFLFRYEPYARVRTDVPVVPRLVPVPTRGLDRCREADWAEGFCPGDPCLVVTAVRPDSIADDAGVCPGDLVLRIGTSPCGEGVFVTKVLPGGKADAKGAVAWSRVPAVDNQRVRTLPDWCLLGNAPHAQRSVQIGGAGLIQITGKPLGEALGIEVGGPEDVMNVPAPKHGAKLTLLCSGTALELFVPEGIRPGLACEVTAYPLICSDENRVKAGRVEARPGSYLLLARRQGFEDQRFPVVVPRNDCGEVHLRLLPINTTPGGFVWIPRGPCLIGGEPRPNDPAWSPGERERTVLEGFFIRRTEITNREWFEFLNDPGIRRKIAEKRKLGVTVYLPRHYDREMVLCTEDADGTYRPVDPPEAPVLGISAEDVDAFLEWRNHHANDGWIWGRPGFAQWQKAARGVDGRFHPWGDRFDADLCHSHDVRRSLFRGVASRFEPRDESPYGVADMAGSRREWVNGGLCGGSWGDQNRNLFRCSRCDGVASGYFNYTCGFRPVAEPAR